MKNDLLESIMSQESCLDAAYGAHLSCNGVDEVGGIMIEMFRNPKTIANETKYSFTSQTEQSKNFIKMHQTGDSWEELPLLVRKNFSRKRMMNKKQ